MYVKEDKLKSISVSTYNGFHYCNADTIVLDSYNSVDFISIIGYSSIIKSIIKTFKEKKTQTLYYGGQFCAISATDYEVISKKTDGSDYMHAIIYKKDSFEVSRSNEETYTSYIFINDEEELADEVYKRLTKYSFIPILKEWMPYIISKLTEENVLEELTTKQYIPENSNKKNLLGYMLRGSQNLILHIVKEGLSSNILNINGTNNHSYALDSCNGIDSYLQLFGEGLAKKIQESFRPKFIPGEDKYDNYLSNIDDYVYYNAGINLYEAQRAAIQSIVNNMKINTNTFLVGEMGSGKTLMASSACYVHNANKKKGFNAIVMCPSHLINNWKNEIARFIPNSKAYIIHNLEELLEIEAKLTDPYKIENSFVILSKESAKIGYINRPAVLFKRVGQYKNESNRIITAHNVFVCPECGQVLTKTIKVPAYPGARRKVDKTVPLELTDFTKENAYNMVCTNKVKVYDQKEECYVARPCGNKLWTAMNRDDENNSWIKLGKNGWVHKDTVSIMTDNYIANGIPNKEADLFKALTEQYNSIQNTGEAVVHFRGTKKYPVAKYIKKRMNNIFDYGIFDESQNYKGKTEQGHAFHILAQSCKKTINCTGTLMNGYVNSMYYLLYRLFPKTMKAEGYNYQDENEFNRIFGVYSTTTTRDGNRVKRGSMKLLPGISSLVFTKFLLNNTVFVSLEDMTEGLPNYTEIPYGVSLDSETNNAYQSYERFVSSILSDFSNENRKYVRQYCKRMLTLPDAPHCLESEYSEEGELLYASPQIDEFNTNKDLALLDIVNTKALSGEKVLVYYNDVGTTNLGSHIKQLLDSYGFKSAELKASIKAEKREEYINNSIKSGTQVLICNPALVETGLNLLDFTTIIFYQLGYNLNTMRQASRRSWRLSQNKDITVYFLYYKDTTQENTLSLMATKLHAAQSMEGKFSEEGLRAMSDNQDVLTQIASNIVDGIKDTVDQNLFKSSNFIKSTSNTEKVHYRTKDRIEIPMTVEGRRYTPSIFKTKHKGNINNNIIELFK